MCKSIFQDGPARRQVRRNQSTMGSTVAPTRRTGLDRWLAVFACVILCMASCSPRPGQAVGAHSERPFYAGRSLELLVPYATGGGTDLQARFMTPYLRKYIAGNPRIQVVNVPGADGVIGLNKFALTQPHNGDSAIFGTGAGSLLYLLREPGVRYDLRKFVPALAVPGGDVFYVSPSTGVKKPADLLRPNQPLRLAAAMPVGGDTLALVALKLLGVKAQAIMGYEGKGRARVAFEQGETNLDYQSTTSYLMNVTTLVERGQAVPLFTTGLMKGGQLLRDPVFPHLPTVGEAYEEMYGGKPAGPAWEAVKALVTTVNTMQKILWFHADAPPEAVEAVRAAAAKMAQDPQFLREGMKIMGDYRLVFGEDLDVQFHALLNTPVGAGDWILQFLIQDYGVTPR